MTQTARSTDAASQVAATALPAGVEITAPVHGAWSELLTRDALAFWVELERRFGPRRRELLQARCDRQRRLDAGATLGFLPETAHVRAADWRVAPPPADLTDRRVEITGPVDRKMVINALNSGANVFMADFEDSCSPTWGAVLDGQVNLRDAIAGTIAFDHPESGKRYRLGEETATLVARPRGWHLVEKHVKLDGEPVSASLFDFALYLFHNAQALLAKGSGPYFYLPKLESHLEARLWNDAFVAAQQALGLPRGTIRATVLIETLPAAFEMEEILYELREHSTGLNCGRWDYIFSYVKRHRADPRRVLPDRDSVGMDRPFLRAYSELLVRTCHARGAHAMGGMAAQIPLKDEAANEAALAKVRADKRREAEAGHDGTWVAHPGLVAIARAEFDRVLDGRPNQLDVTRDDVEVGAEDLLAVPEGAVTEAGIRKNLNVGVRYLAAWLEGNGCVPIDGLMEDAATAEISRTQLWQWIRHRVALDDGRVVTEAFVFSLLNEELRRIEELVGRAAFRGGRYDCAVDLFRAMCSANTCPEFLTLRAYERL